MIEGILHRNSANLTYNNHMSPASEMFVLVKYGDGVKKIVPSSDIKHFDPENINFTKKYKIKWKDGEYYDGVIVIVGETEKEVRDKDAAKRHKIRPFKLCDSADDTDNSLVEKTSDKNNNDPTGIIKKALSKKIEKLQLNVDRLIKSSETQNGREHIDINSKQTAKLTTGSDVSRVADAVTKTITQTKKQDQGKVGENIKKLSTGKSAGASSKITTSDKKLHAKTTANVVTSTIASAAKTVVRKPSNHKQRQNVNADSEAHSKLKVGTSTGAPTPDTVIEKQKNHEKPQNSSAKNVEKLNKQFKRNLNCDSCKILTKKLEDATDLVKKLEKQMQDAETSKRGQLANSEIKKLDSINTQLKQALKDKEKMLLEATRLNMDLQVKVLNEFDEMKVLITDIKERAQINLERNQGVMPVGYKRLDKSMIHLGQDVWIPIPQYDSISSLSDTAAKFVKNISIAVYGTPTLKTSSVTGIVSNRLRNKDKNAIARPKLDPTKLIAIKDALRFWLTTEKKLDEVSIDMEVARVGSHISHKIFELLRRDKKSVVEYNNQVIPNVELAEDEAEENEQPPGSPESMTGTERESAPENELAEGARDSDQESEGGHSVCSQSSVDRGSLSDEHDQA